MSSMSVVDGMQLVDVNKKTHPQDILTNKSKNITHINFPDINDLERLPYYNHKNNASNIIYSDYLNGKIVDYPPDFFINNNIPKREDLKKLNELKGFTSIFFPVYSFVKNITPDFTVPDIFKFSFTPMTNFFDALLSTVSDTCVSIYESGKKAISSTVDFIKGVGESVFDTSVNFGKSVISSISNFFGGGSPAPVSNDKPVVQPDKIESDNSVKDNVEKIENRDLKKPYWYTLKNINDNNSSIFSGKKFQNNFNELKKTLKLDNDFLSEGEDSVLQVNGQPISKHSPATMLNDFKYVLPNLESRQLISSYSHQDLFSRPYLELFSERPELADLKLKDIKVSYVADELDDNQIQLVATSKARLDSNTSYKADGNTYDDSFGIQASMILSKDKVPNIEYVYFLM
ncbi:hypothetical protein XW81_02720 [Buchnera aphidicola (Schlechtendalia chinensis)]|uniref:Uncharacterized protein n=1 Tax=Buchnera aphidicola subsp. Schlechtendalia chinensis TaxID=118110 RepID=A0A172WEA1_BUCSC|nr:hypothetical protein [Buchnera aphidicola]ANF17277.1 hypothetical protein XW81_02720 [Buchnera aphidicola (Schlechtendalia chinensis)]